MVNEAISSSHGSFSGNGPYYTNESGINQMKWQQCLALFNTQLSLLSSDTTTTLRHVCFRCDSCWCFWNTADYRVARMWIRNNWGAHFICTDGDMSAVLLGVVSALISVAALQEPLSCSQEYSELMGSRGCWESRLFQSFWHGEHPALIPTHQARRRGLTRCHINPPSGSN